MVLQFLLPLLTGVGGKGGALSGLAQGGGFGLGYGFMVRAGYDLYGAIKDQVMGSLMGARYVPTASTSMMGTGGLMGLKHNPANRDIDTTTLNSMTEQRKASLGKKLGGTHKIPAYLKAKGITPASSGSYSKPPYKTIRPHVERWETQFYNLRHGKYDRFINNFNF